MCVQVRGEEKAARDVLVQGQPELMCVYRQEAKKKLPEMFWSKVDLRQLAQHKEHSSGLGQHNGLNARRTLRKMDTSKKATGSSR